MVVSSVSVHIFSLFETGLHSKRIHYLLNIFYPFSPQYVPLCCILQLILEYDLARYAKHLAYSIHTRTALYRLQHIVPNIVSSVTVPDVTVSDCDVFL